MSDVTFLLPSKTTELITGFSTTVTTSTLPRWAMPTSENRLVA